MTKIDAGGDGNDGNDDEGEYKRKIHEMDWRCEKGIWSAGGEHIAPINKHNINGSQCSPSHELITKTSMDIKATVNHWQVVQFGHILS